jgi:hypothetical protein
MISSCLTIIAAFGSHSCVRFRLLRAAASKQASSLPVVSEFLRLAICIRCHASILHEGASRFSFAVRFLFGLVCVCVCVCVLELVSLRVREFVNRARSGGRRRRSCGFFFFAKPFVYHGDARTRPYGRTLEHSLLR